MQIKVKITVKAQLVQKLSESRRTEGRTRPIALPFPANAVVDDSGIFLGLLSGEARYVYNSAMRTKMRRYAICFLSKQVRVAVNGVSCDNGIPVCCYSEQEND